jgi:hypothetical protein
MEESGQRHSPAALLPGKTRQLLYSRLWAPGPVWMGAENLAPTGIRFDPRNVQPIASHYTDWAMLRRRTIVMLIKFFSLLIEEKQWIP